MKRSMAGVWLLVALLFLAGCEGTPKTGPVKVRWDRVICVRCLMAVSDHSFSAQVRGGPIGKKSKVYFYDDIGCAVLWLDEQDWWDGGNWWEDPATEIWVTDWTDQSWIDARSAFYVKGHITPMDFQLGAQVNEVPGALNFEEAMQHIRTREQEAH
jgi:copper chaperone NosL